MKGDISFLDPHALTCAANALEHHNGNPLLIARLREMADLHEALVDSLEYRLSQEISEFHAGSSSEGR